MYVAAGDYHENPSVGVGKNGLTLQGQDKATTRLFVTGSYGVTIYADGVTFDGFTVKQNSAAVVQKGLGLMNGATGCTVSNSIFDGTGSTKSGSMGILVRDSNNVIDGVESFGWTGLRAQSPRELDDVIARMIEADGPVIADICVDKAENCFPMIPSGAAHCDMLLGPEDEAARPISEEGMVLV